MRSVLDMIDCLNAPIAPGGDPDGFHLVDLDDHDCRFPTSQDRRGIRFVMTDARIKRSPDGKFHWCSVAGADDSRTICLFVPPRGF